MATGLDSRVAHIPGLDGLRGFAALCVLLSHGLSTYTAQRLHEGLGQMGVALFFVLSAYLLTRRWGNVALNRANMTTYVVHRIARVVPLFWLAVPVYVALYRETYWNGAVCAAAISCAWSLWTIPVELQFYAIFMILWRDMQRGRPGRGLAWCSLTIAGIGVVMFATDTDNIRFPMWAHFFFIGCAMALWFPARPFGRWGGGLCFAALSLFLLSIPGLRIESGLATLENNLDPLVIISVILLFTAALCSPTLTKWLERPIARAAGRISFGIYIIHWPMLIIIERLGLTGGVALLIYCMISINLAVVSARWVEEPAKRKINRMAQDIARFRAGRRASRSRDSPGSHSAP